MDPAPGLADLQLVATCMQAKFSHHSVDVDAARWRRPAGVFKIRNVGANRVLGITGASKDAGATALVWDDTGTADHLWQPVRRGDDWVLQSINSGMVLGVRNMGRSGGEDVLQWPNTGTLDHQWQLVTP